MARSLRLRAFPSRAAGARGLNYSGMEYNTGTLPGTAGQDFFLATTTDHQYATTKGFNIVRLALAWERVQPTKSGALSETYMGYVDTFITNAATYGWKVLIELHNFGGRKVAGVDQVINDGTLTYADFNDVWVRIASRYAGNNTVWGYDLMNEPHGMPVATTSSNYNSTATWTLAAQGAINAIRAIDTYHYIVVCTDNFSGFQNFFSDGSGYGANPTPWWTDSASKLYYSVHCYFDSDNSGAYSGANQWFSGSGRDIRYGGDTIKTVLDWGVANNVNFVIGEYGVKNEDDAWLVMENDFLNVIDGYPTAITFGWAFGSAYTSATTFSPTNTYTTDRNQMRAAAQHVGAAPPTVTIPPFVFGTAISTSATHYSSQAHSLSIPSILSELVAPYPTNVWWTNLFMGSNRIAPDPYQVKPVTQGLYACYAARTVATTSITTAFLQNLAIEASETIAARKIESYTDLGVAYRWDVDATHTMKSYLVQGMAYVTMEFTALTPKITTQHAILSVNGNGTPGDVTDTKFKVVLNNGQTWIVYSSSSITFTWSNTGGWRMLAGSTFTGTLQIAYLKDSSYETTLDTYSLNYARGGTVNAIINSNTASITFTWDKQGSGSLLHFAYPHHIDVLQSPTTTSLSYKAIKGDMTGVVGSIWTMQESLTTKTWDAPRSIDPTKLATIQTSLTTDKTYTSDTPNDPYFGGKQYAKIGRLLVMAENSEINDTAAATTLRATGKTTIQAWLDKTNSNKIKYDTTWKGICTTDGMALSSNDFGAGWYNDHHFHWGYHIYLCAAIARNDASWLTSYRDKVNVYVRDIMNPSSSDTYFTRFRHFDWFAGHSWASGLFDFGDAKNQESTSEAINAWYSCMLWGIASGDNNIKEHARILLAMEQRSAKKYWHIYTGNNQYDAGYTGKGVGVLWATKIDDATFFGSNLEYRRMIQVIPITPIMEEYIESAWASTIMTEMAGIIAGAADGWKNFIYATEAVNDKATAWTDIATLVDYDGGNSKTNQQYWGATRA